MRQEPNARLPLPLGEGWGKGNTVTAWPARVTSTLLLGVFALALLLRFWGLGWQLPFAFHPDEGHYVWKAEEMFREGHLNPKYFRNPSLFTYTILGELKTLEIAGLLQPRAEPGDGLLAAPSIYTYLGRVTSAVLGAMSVLAVYDIGRTWVGQGVAVLGALFLATCFLHVRDSHYATNDVPAVTLVLLSVWLSLRGLQQPSIGIFAWAGLLGGLATSAKYSMGLYIVPLGLAWLLTRQSGWPPARRALSAGAAALTSTLAYLAGTPYALLTWDKFRTDFLVQMRLGTEGWEGQASTSVVQLYLDTLVTGLGWPLMLLAAIGAVLAMSRDWRGALVLLGFPVGYGLFMSQQQLFFARFALPLAPFFALFAALAVLALSRQMKDSRGAIAVAAVLAVVVVLPSMLSVMAHNTLVSRPDTRVLAFEWMVANLPARSKIAVEDYTIRDRRPKAYLDDGRAFDTDLINVNDVRDPASVLRGPFDYVVTSSFNTDRFTADPQRFPRQNGFYQALEREARLIAEFRPGKDGTAIPFDIEDLYTPLWRLDRYERMGPSVRVYQLQRGA
ncbi:MAG: ArnT family glycosyltransferase [Chloroflexota bacterium]